MSKRIITLILIGCGMMMDVYPQQTWPLKQCIEYGLKNNRNSKIYANEKLATDARTQEALADYLPRISLNASYDNNLRLQQTVIPSGILGSEEIRGSLSQRYATDAVAQIDQVIYDQSLLTALKANKYVSLQADLNEQQAQDAIIYNISIAYFQMFVYTRQLELLENNRQNYQEQIKIYTLQVGKGILLQKDLDKVTVDHNNTLSQIRVAQRNLELAENELKFQMGYSITQPISLDGRAEMELSLSEDTPPFNPATRADYKAAELSIKILEIQQKAIRAEALPKLSAYFRYGAVSYADHLKNSYDELSPYSTVGLKLSIPILDFYKRNARYKQAKIRSANAEESLKLAEGKYTMEYENAYTKLLQARTNTDNDRRNLALAESVLKVTDLQLKKGITDLTDWLGTQYALKESQNSYLNSLYLYHQSRIELEKAAGTLKNFYNSL